MALNTPFITVHSLRGWLLNDSLFEDSIFCFGDSMNVINWIKKTQVCRHLRLENILTSIADIIDTFDSFSCSHVYRENNREADLASKEGLLLMEGQWKIYELIDGTEHTFYHCPFIEGVAPQ